MSKIFQFLQQRLGMSASEATFSIILCSKVSVLWVVGSWRGRKVKKSFTSMEIRQTQNSCSKQFILQISSVFTEQWRLGVNKSVWQRKKRDESIYLWTTRCWQVYNGKKYNSWYLIRQRHLETVCEKTFWASKRWPVEYGSHNYVKKTYGQPGRITKIDLTETTVGEQSLLYDGNTHFLDLFWWQLFPKAQSLDQFWNFKLWKFLMDEG